MSIITMVPAYGRDYTSIKAVRDDFHAGRDFVIADISNRWDGKPANKQSLVEAGITRVLIRYKKLRSVMMIDVAETWPKPAKKTEPSTTLASPDPEES